RASPPSQQAAHSSMSHARFHSPNFSVSARTTVMNHAFRQTRRSDRLLASFGHALTTLFGHTEPGRPSPGDSQPHSEMDRAERRHVAGLIRVNHTGEVCAQALYLGQAAL